MAQIRLIGTDPFQVPTNGMLGSLAFQSAESVSIEKLVVTENVGIGTLTPTSRLEIVGNASYDAKVTFSRVPTVSTNNAVIGELFFQNNTDSIALISVKQQSASDDAYIQFATQQAGGGLTERLRITSTGTVNIVGAGTAGSTQAVSFNGSAPVNSVVLDSNGRVGLGTSGPVSGNVAILNIRQIGGNLSTTTVTRANAQGVIIADGPSTSNSVGNGIWFDSGSLLAGIASTRANTGNWGTDLRFYTHPDTTTNQDETYERLRITSAGNLLVGSNGTGPGTTGRAVFASSQTYTNSGDNAGQVHLINTDNTVNNRSSLQYYNSSGSVVAGIDSVNRSHTAQTGDLQFWTIENGGLKDTMRMSNGNISAGGNISLAGSQSTPRFIFANGDGDDSHLGIKAGSTAGVFSQIDVVGNWNGSAQTGGRIAFTTGGAERARIRADGMFEVKGGGVAGTSPALSVSGSAPANSLVLDSNGRVGIGINTPEATLDISDSIKIRGQRKSYYFDGLPPNYPSTTQDRIVELTSKFAPSAGTDVLINNTGGVQGDWQVDVVISGDANGPGVGVSRLTCRFQSRYNHGAGAIDLLNIQVIDKTIVSGTYYGSIPINIAIVMSGNNIMLTIGGSSGYSTGIVNVKWMGSGTSSGSPTSLTLPGTTTSSSWVTETSWGYDKVTGNNILIAKTGGAERARIRADGMFEVKGAGTAGSSPAFSVNGSAPANSVVIDSSGRLGIGISNVKGTLALEHGNTSPQGLTDVAIDALRISSTIGAVVAIRATQYDSVNQPAAGDTQFFNLLFNGSTYNYYERMRITATGRVGIGATNPLRKLDVRGDILVKNLINSNNYSEIIIGSSIVNGDLQDYGVSIRTIVESEGANTYGMQFFTQGSYLTGQTEKMRIAGSGAVTVYGSLSKGSGSFKVNHPLPEKSETHHLVHSFVESPQANNIYRGKATLTNGNATINLDEVSVLTEGTFALLNRDIHCFTSNETDWDNVKGSVNENILTITCQNPDSTAVVTWLVIGERHDQHMYDTDWTDENGRVITEPLKGNSEP